MITVVTDVVRENNQTYRLGWTEQCKDGTKMGVGSPEYVLLFHKPQTDRSRGYADVPVSKVEGRLHPGPLADRRARLLAFERQPAAERRRARRDGPRPASRSSSPLRRLKQVYDYESHVQIGEALDGRGALPSKFMALAPGSHDPTCGTTSTGCAP